MNIDMVKFAKAMADSTRQAMLKELCCQWLCISDLVERLDVSQPTVSHHCSVLGDAGLLIKRREGKQVYCTLNQEMMTFCCGQLMATFAPQQTLSVEAIAVNG